MSRAKTVGASEAGRILGVSRVWIHQLRKRGELEAELQHGFWRFRLSSVNKLARKRARKGATR